MKKLPPLIIIVFLIPLITSASVGFEDMNQGKVVVVESLKKVTTFLKLSDTPSSYSGEGGNCVVVNAGETALEFGACGTGSGSQWDIDDYTLVNNSDVLEVNKTFLNFSTSLYINDTGVSGGNPFNQSLNTSDNVIFNNLNLTGNITMGTEILFTFQEMIDNYVDGWLRLTGEIITTSNLNVTGNFTFTERIKSWGNLSSMYYNESTLIIEG